MFLSKEESKPELRATQMASISGRERLATGRNLIQERLRRNEGATVAEGIVVGMF